jgi:putative transposase
MDKFSFEAHRTKRAKNYKVWQDRNHAKELGRYIPLEQKLDYLHHNPVRASWVEYPEDFLYSSARNYSGKTGLIHGITVLS